MTDEEYKKNPDLIQRCKLKTRKKGEIDGIDSLLSFDYMGSSEFEWGALPAALRVMCHLVGALTVVEVTFGKKSLWLVCEEVEKDDATRMLKLVSNEKHRTKEYVGIGDYLSGAEKDRGYCGWWDIQHNWMAFVDKELAELAIYAIRKVRDRWNAQGKL